MTRVTRVPDAAQHEAKRSGALQIQDPGVLAELASRICGASLRAAPRAGHTAGIVVLAAVLMVLGCSAAAAGDVAAGKRKALQCQTCHGLDGLSKLPEAPHLAGQPEPYLVKSLNDYRTGVRRHDMMTIVVQPLTDQDVADLAAYYAAIEFTVKPPQ
jgi:cytochrome c553